MIRNLKWILVLLVAGTASAKWEIIDLDHGFAVGTDGIHLSLKQRGDAFHITAAGRLSKLKLPWENPYGIELMIHGKKDLPLFLNGTPATIGERGGMRFIRCKVTPDGRVSISSD